VRLYMALLNPGNSLASDSRSASSTSTISRERIAHDNGKEFRLKKGQILIIRKAQNIIGTAVHPDTSNIVTWYQRMSSFLYCKLPLSIGLTMAATTIAQTVF
jgi:hypothetical protein